MKYLILVILSSMFLLQNCNYVTFTRHLNVNLDDSKSFSQSGTFKKTYLISTTKIINAITENIDSKSARIEKLEIESMKLKVSLLPNNTASSIHNIHIRLAKGWSENSQTLVKLDTSRIIVNKAIIYVVNAYLDLKGVGVLKKDLVKNLATGNPQVFELEMQGLIPTGQTFLGNIALELKATMDAVTCEKVPLGLGPSECMVIPFTIKL